MLSENLQVLRKAKHWSQEALAEQLNVSRQVIAKWEAGESSPDINICTQLAHLYNISLDELVGEEPFLEAKATTPEGKYVFGTVTIGERGQIVIPKKARDVFNLKAGDDLVVLGDIAQGIALVNANEFIKAIRDINSKIRNEHD